MDVDGPNLRRMYLPGLDALKHELAKIEHLTSLLMPELHVRLQVGGLRAVRSHITAAFPRCFADQAHHIAAYAGAARALSARRGGKVVSG